MQGASLVPFHAHDGDPAPLAEHGRSAVGGRVARVGWMRLGAGRSLAGAEGVVGIWAWVTAWH